MKNNDQHKKERRRKLLLILPLLVLPILTMLFWAMGGGSATSTGASSKKGFNIKLPAAQLKDEKSMDKLNYYDQAALDSTKLDEMRRKDPNYRFASKDSTSSQTGSASGLQMDNYQSPQEEKVYKRLEQLQRAISNSAQVSQGREVSSPAAPASVARYEAELAQLIAPMEASSQPDPEMQQISGMLENILDLQYPERMEQKLKAESAKNRGNIYGVSTAQEQQVIGSINPSSNPEDGFGRGTQHSGFFGLEQQAYNVIDNAVSAIVAETQTVVNGSTVKMSLAQDIYVNGNKIPKNTFVYGTASLKGERLAIEITNIRHGNSIYPVELAVYDLDGLTGIYIPGAINRDVAKSSADRSVQTLGVTTLSDSWGAQAAGAGIEAAKGLFSRKVKLIKVNLKAGYSVLLRDEKQKDN
jgi:conjugative transposon TraM protein